MIDLHTGSFSFIHDKKTIAVRRLVIVAGPQCSSFWRHQCLGQVAGNTQNRMTLVDPHGLLGIMRVWPHELWPGLERRGNEAFLCTFKCCHFPVVIPESCTFAMPCSSSMLLGDNYCCSASRRPSRTRTYATGRCSTS